MTSAFYQKNSDKQQNELVNKINQLVTILEQKDLEESQTKIYQADPTDINMHEKGDLNTSPINSDMNQILSLQRK